MTKTPQEVITKVGKASKLVNIAADIGIVMNQSKEEHQVGFVRPGSVKSMRTLYKGNEWPDDMGKLCPTQSVLGTLRTYNCSNVAERQARSSPPSGSTDWMDGDGSFLERSVFTADSSHHFSQHGLVSTLNRVGDSFAQQSRLQSLSLMRGKASGRWIDTDGTKRYHALPNAEVLRWLKLVPTHLELQVRRLRWWQTILVDREGNEALWVTFLADWERKLKDHCWRMAPSH